MKLEIDSRAVARFNEIGEELLARVLQEPHREVQRNAFTPDVHISVHVSPKEIVGPVRMETDIIDGTGAPVGLFARSGQQRIGLVGEPFRSLLRLLERVRGSGLEQTVSSKTLLETSLKWIEQRNVNTGGKQLVPYLLQEIGQMVREHELWIPLHRVYLARPIVLGSVRLETISKTMLDQREQELRSRASPEDLPIIAQRMEQDRKRLQGTAAAVVILTAEPSRAEEIARERSEQAAALLRFFSPTNWHPEMRSYCTLLGDEDLRMETLLRMKDGKLLTGTCARDRRNPPDWFATPDIERFPAQLALISELVTEGREKTNFQERLLEALLLYSRNSVAREPVDKLVYIFAALESMLLKDGSEPIQGNLALRAAFLIGDDAKARKEIAANVRAVYSKRSSFVHHGRSLDSAGDVAQFMLNAWTCFHAMLELSRTVVSKEALLDQLEERKFQ